ncbi:hypothetical protein ABIE41_001476 [Bosea sp. OAE506]|uniref:hypothetical protein n=1 Tax=Bosea sp. OAE506 TaxID=2663870 RepID=UPI0017898E78
MPPPRNWTYAITVAVLTAALMTIWGIVIRPFTDGFSNWLAVSIGPGWALAAILGFFGALGLYGWWPHADAPPPLVIRKPLWWRVATWVFLGIPAVGLVVGMGTFIAYQLYRN